MICLASCLKFDSIENQCLIEGISSYNDSTERSYNLVKSKYSV